MSKTEQYLVELLDQTLDITVQQKGTNVCVGSDPDDESREIKIVRESDGVLYVKFPNRCFRVGMNRKDQNTIEWTINGITFTTRTANKLRARLREQGGGKKGDSDIERIEASIPGQIGTIMVEEGDQIEKDSSILTLSAMKLENEVKSLTAGTVKEIHVEQGENVQKGTLLAEIKRQ